MASRVGSALASTLIKAVRVAKREGERLVQASAAPRFQVLYQLAHLAPAERVLRRLGPLRAKEMRRFVSRAELQQHSAPGEFELLQLSTDQLLACGPRFAAEAADLQKPRPAAEFLPGPELYAAVLRRVEVLGGSNAVLVSGQRALYDLRDFDQERRFRYSDEGLHGYRRDICAVKRQGYGDDVPRAIHLGGNYAWNYYHFVIEVLPRLRAVDALNLDPAIPLLVDQIHLEIPQHLALLTALNRDGRPILAMQPALRYRVGELYYCSFPNLVVPNYHRMSQMRASDTRLDAAALIYVRDQLREQLAGPGAPHQPWPKRIYLSRKKASHRRKFNEDDVLTALSALGVVAVHPEELSIAQQIDLFAAAELIVGGSGAAFTNLLFCQPGCKALVIAKERLDVGLFSSLAAVTGVDLLYHAANADADSDTPDPHGEFTIDAHRLAELLAAWLGAGENSPSAAEFPSAPRSV
jgi:capsular polysaccharide biosynthesis protein